MSRFPFVTRVVLFVTLFFAVACNPSKGNSEAPNVPPLVAQGTPTPAPSSNPQDTDFVGLAGNCKNADASASELAKDDKLLNSLAELRANPNSERAKKLRDSAKANNWTCANPGS